MKLSQFGEVGRSPAKLSRREALTNRPKGGCPATESLSQFGEEAEALRDDFCVAFREPELETLRKPLSDRLRILRRRKVHLSATRLDDELARVYENTLVEFYAFARPGEGGSYADFVERAASKSVPATPGIEEVFAQRLAPAGAVVVAHVSYPLANPAWFIFDALAPVTFGLLAYAHALAYRLVYAIDQAAGLETQGVFGIGATTSPS